MNMHDLYKKSQSLPAGEVILDVRRPDEFADGHIAGAINISHDEVPSRIAELKKYKRVYMHCRSGGRVSRTAAALDAASSSNIEFITDGGMLEWIEAGYPVKK